MTTKKKIVVLLTVFAVFCIVMRFNQDAVSRAIASWDEGKSKPVIYGTTEDGPSIRDPFSLPKSGRPAIRFAGKQQVVVDLRTDEWSPQIIVPPLLERHYRVDVEPPTGFSIEFANGRKDTVHANQTRVPNWGFGHGVFWLIGTTPSQKATITLLPKGTR